jgi:6-phosphogluconolactonase
MKKYQRLLAGLLCLLGLSGCGGSSSNDIIPPVIHPIARIATYLVAGDLDGEINVFSVNTGDGSLQPVPGSPFKANNPLINVAVHPNGRLVFGGTLEPAVLEGFSLTPETGALSPLPGYPAATVPRGSPVFDIPGEFLYVVGSTDIDAFRVDPASGNLARLAGFPFTLNGLGDGRRPEVSPDNRFLFFCDAGNNQVFSLAINSQTGALSVVDVEPSNGVEPTSLGMTSDGRYLYVAHTDGTLQGFAVAGDGTLAPLPGSATFANAPALSYQIGFFGDLLFLSDLASDTLNAFRISANGALTQVAGYPLGGGGGGGVLVYPFPLGDFLYVSDLNDGAIDGYRVDATAVLMPVPGSPATGLGLVTELEAAVVSF